MTASTSPPTTTITVGVLALQGGFYEHLTLLRLAAPKFLSSLLSSSSSSSSPSSPPPTLSFIEVRNPTDLSRTQALVIPGGESTTISLVATQSGLLTPLRDFVRSGRPVWGTCAGLILLSDEANATSVKKGGQELIGGLAVRVHRNHFGRQIESFIADLELPFLNSGDGDSEASKVCTTFPGVFIRAPIVEAVLSSSSTSSSSASSSSSEQGNNIRPPVETLAVLPGRKSKAGLSRPSESDGSDEVGDIVAVRQGNIFATSFHPELTDDVRIHVWWLGEVIKALS